VVLRLNRLFAGRRLALCALVAALFFLALPEGLRLPMRIAAGWIVGTGLFLALTALVFAGAPPERVRQRARQQDQRSWVILLIIVVGASISLLALGFTLKRPPHETAIDFALRLALVALTVAASWMLTHTMFALRYAHHFYGDGPAPGAEDDRGGLVFPGNDAPDYWDFVYFSYVIGMTCQVSDVQISSRAMRRMALAHGVLSFFFNTVILSLAINLLAGSL